MLITENFFKKDNCCSSIVQFLLNEDQTKYKILIKKSITDDYFSWFNNNITAVMNKKQSVQYAVFSAELVLPIFEKRHRDKKPRQSIKAAKKWIEDPSKENQRMVFYRSKSQSAFYPSYAYYAEKSASCVRSTVSTNGSLLTDFAANRAAFYASKCNTSNNKISNQIIQYGLKLIYSY